MHYLSQFNKYEFYVVKKVNIIHAKVNKFYIIKIVWNQIGFKDELYVGKMKLNVVIVLPNTGSVRNFCCLDPHLITIINDTLNMIFITILYYLAITHSHSHERKIKYLYVDTSSTIPLPLSTIFNNTHLTHNLTTSHPKSLALYRTQLTKQICALFESLTPT